ncbi:odorant receptor 19 [Nasonia vitripennis]|uniref:Odorant receptor n=1 Tax=Nasonia vitripennis TaxID=7425 RepID=A0A7M6W8I0_NASVI|nr:odorant receptor 19 [Nasonia vitripennis]
MTTKEEGFDVAIGITRFVMRTHGIWPGFSVSKAGIMRYAYLPAALMLLLFVIIPQTVQVIFVSRDLNAVLNVLTLGNVPVGIALAKLLGVSYKQNVLHQLILSVCEDWKHTTKESELVVMRLNARKSRMFSIICIVLSEGTAMAYSARMFYAAFSTHTKAQATGIDDCEKPLFFIGKFPFDPQSYPNYQITWTLQIIATFLAAGAFSSVDALFVTLVLHLCGQLTNLQAAFSEIGEENAEKGTMFVSKLSKLIERHRKINVFADIIEYSFNMMFLVQVLSSTLLLCLQGYLFMIILSGQDGLLVEMIFISYFTICFTFSIFVYCYVAELLQEKSLQLGYAIFYSKWYNLPAKKARLLIISIVRCKRPLEISAGKFCIFSLNLFCNIVRTSAGYMSVLLAVKDKIT